MSAEIVVESDDGKVAGWIGSHGFVAVLGRYCKNCSDPDDPRDDTCRSIAPDCTDVLAETDDE